MGTSDGLDVWYRNDPDFPTDQMLEIRKVLEAEHIKLFKLSGRTPNGIGLFFLTNVDEQSLNDLNVCSRNGVNRVLVLAPSRDAISGNRVWRLLGCGASDVLICCESKSRVATQLRQFARIDNLIASPMVKENLVGQSPIWISVLRQVVDAALTNTSVLIMGETGTGKELVARLIHSLDQRPNKGNLVVVDCTTIVPELSGSEFFGHVRGAYTSAAHAREGAISLANGGTLFLDEVGELPLPLQAELLRVIQEGSYKPVGSDKWEKAEFRLVCATNRDLVHEQERGKFRRDLFYRIAGWVCRVPALGKRREDIMPLTEHFLRQVGKASGRRLAVDPVVREFLLRRNYPGNVRDLRQIVTAAACHHVGDGQITAGDIPVDERAVVAEDAEAIWPDASFRCSIRCALSQGIGLKDISSKAGDIAVEIALEEFDRNVPSAAAKLGITPRALQMRLAADRGRDPTIPQSTKSGTRL